MKSSGHAAAAAALREEISHHFTQLNVQKITEIKLNSKFTKCRMYAAPKIRYNSLRGLRGMEAAATSKDRIIRSVC